jgi:hypothetical protein
MYIYIIGTMSSNRMEYDECAYAQELKASTDPFRYVMYDGKFTNGKKCIYEGDADKQSFPTRVDIEGNLLGVSRIGTRCVGGKFVSYDGKTEDESSKIYQSINPELCNIYRNENNLKMPTTNGIDDYKY